MAKPWPERPAEHFQVALEGWAVFADGLKPWKTGALTPRFAASI